MNWFWKLFKRAPEPQETPATDMPHFPNLAKKAAKKFGVGHPTRRTRK